MDFTELLSAISEQEKETILKLIESQVGYREENFADYFQTWAQAKFNIYKTFGNKFRLSKPLEITTTQEILTHIYSKDTQFCSLRSNIIKLFWRLKPFTQPSQEQIHYHLFRDEYFASNLYGGPALDIVFNNSQTLKVRKGAKLMKTLGKLIAEIDYPELNEIFEEFRLQHSRIGNTKTIKGELCLSIHPLDFITMSYNSYDWRSCMNWNDGEYRAGIMEMINSPNVVIAYLKGNRINPHQHNPILAEALAKKWRSLFIVTEDVITSVVGYPYQNEALTKECLTWLWELNGKQHNIPETFIHNPNLKCDTLYMFNDMMENQDVTKYALFRQKPSLKPIYLNYSGPCQCLLCNKTDVPFADQGNLVCADCDSTNYTTCACCDGRIPIDDTYDFADTFYDIGPFCYDCYMASAVDPVTSEIICDVENQAEVTLNITLADASVEELQALGYTTSTRNEYKSIPYIQKHLRERHRPILRLFFLTEDNWEQALASYELFDSAAIYEHSGEYCLPIRALTNSGFSFAANPDNLGHGTYACRLKHFPLTANYFGQRRRRQWEVYKAMADTAETY